MTLTILLIIAALICGFIAYFDFYLEHEYLNSPLSKNYD